MATSYGSSTITAITDNYASQVVIPAPAGVALGDILVAGIVRWEVSNPAISFGSTGFALIGQAVNGNEKLAAVWKRAVAADVTLSASAGSYTFTWTGSQYTGGSMIRIPGALASGDPIGTAWNTATGSASATPSTAAAGDTGAFCAHFQSNEDNCTHTPPTGGGTWQEPHDGQYLATSYRVATTTGTQTASGATSTPASVKCAFLVIVAPEPSGGGTPINVTLNRATETDTGRALTRSKSLALGRAGETVLSRLLTRSKMVPLLRTTEADSARPFTTFKSINLGRATESNIGRQTTKSALWSLLRSTETDTARPLGHYTIVHLGRAVQSEVARPVGLGSFITVTLGRATETDTARALTPAKRVTFGRAIEVQTSQGLTRVKNVVLGRALELEIARALGASHTVTLGCAADTSSARSMSWHRIVHLVRAVEQQVAREVAPPSGPWPPVFSFGEPVILVQVAEGHKVAMVRTTYGTVVTDVDVSSL